MALCIKNRGGSLPDIDRYLSEPSLAQGRPLAQGGIQDFLADPQGVRRDLRGTYTRLEFSIPARGLIGYRGEFLTDTKGTGCW